MRRKYIEIGFGNKRTGREYTIKIYLFDLLIVFLAVCILAALRKNGSI